MKQLFSYERVAKRIANIRLTKECDPIKNILSIIKKAFIYGGVEKKEFEDVECSLSIKNRNTLIYASCAFALLFLGMFLSTYLGTDSEALSSLRLRSRYMYLLVMFGCICVTFIAKKIPPKRNILILITCYLFLTGLFFFAIWCGTCNQPYYPSVTFCVFLVALPFLIIDRPYRVSLYLLCVCFVYIFCSNRYKEAELFRLDALNCICFLYLSTAVGLLTQNLRISEAVQKRLIEKQRDMDPLSGLLNKSAFERYICQAVEKKGHGVFLIMDIDDFKLVNDTYGHVYGDAAIRMVADCIKKVFASPAVTGRFGGDEFVVYLDEDTDKNSIAERISTLQSLIRTTAELPSREASITVSIGVRRINSHDTNYIKILDHADKALYRSKRLGKNRFSFSDEED